MSEGKIGAIDGDKLAAYLKTSVDLSKQWSSENDYKRGLKDERLRILDRILEHILTGTFALTATPRDLTPEEALEEARKRWGSHAIIEITVTDDGEQRGAWYLKKWVRPFGEIHKGGAGKTFREAFAKADEAQKESK